LIALGCAVGHNVWARSLEEARNPHSSFEMTRSAWTPVQIAFAIAGITLAFVGKEIVNIIGGGKLRPRLHPCILCHGADPDHCQPASAIVYASDRSALATWTRTIMTLGGLILLYSTILIFGLRGVVAICHHFNP
jgi:hypothetical protein